MIQAIIFDLDGTLLDSVDFHAKAWVDAFQQFGHSVSFDKVRSQIGKGGDQLMPEFLSPEEIEKIGKDLQKARGEIFKSKYQKEIKPFPKVRELLQKIIANGQQPALASSAKGEELETFKKIAGIDDLIAAESSSKDAEKSKPHPDIFEAAIKKLGAIATSEMIAVGDTPYDAEAAGKAGLKTVGVLCGGFPEADLRKAGCIAIYSGPDDLLKNYASSPLAQGA